MKRYLKYILILIYPYWVYMGIRNWNYSVDFLGNSLYILSVPIAASISSIYLFISSLKTQLNADKLILINFICKLLQSPAYFLIFGDIVMSAGPQEHDRNSAFDFALIFNAILILITGLLGAAAIIAFIKERKRSKILIAVFVMLGMGQFILIIDVLTALILLIITRITKRKEKQILSHNQGELV